MKTIDSKPETRIEALAKHLRGMDDLGLGEFRLQTLNGRDFTILQNGKPHFSGSFEQVAQHAGFTA